MTEAGAQKAPKYPARKAYEGSRAADAPKASSDEVERSVALLVGQIAVSAIVAFVVALGLQDGPRSASLGQVWITSIGYAIPIFALVRLVGAFIEERYFSRSTLLGTITLSVFHLYYVANHDPANAHLHIAGLAVVVFIVATFVVVDAIRPPRS